MKNKILLPFNYQNDNREKYAQTMQMAESTNTDVVLFTCISEDASEEEIDKIYQKILELNGFFQSFFGGWKKPKYKIERIIQRGNFGEKLAEYLNSCHSNPYIIE